MILLVESRLRSDEKLLDIREPIVKVNKKTSKIKCSDEKVICFLHLSLQDIIQVIAVLVGAAVIGYQVGKSALRKAAVCCKYIANRLSELH